MTYEGFPTGSLTFLKDLSENNNKGWFDEHRRDYEEFWVEQGKEFVVAAGEPLSRLRPQINADPRVNKSLFRINRDVRFSKDKTPYKETLDLMFWEGERKGAVSSFYFRLTPTTVYAGTGAHIFDREVLAAFRRAVQDQAKADALLGVITDLPEGVSGETYKRTPATDAPVSDHQAWLLRHSALFVTSERTVGAWVGTPEVLDWAVDQWRNQAALHEWLVQNLG